MDGLKQIRDYYRVPAHEGHRVRVDGHLGTIVGSEDLRLLVKVDGDDSPSIWHPTWRVEYGLTAAQLAAAGIGTGPAT